MLAPLRRLLPVLACLALASQAQASPEDYRLDPIHTRVLFRVDHAGFSRALGTFSGATGTLRFDPDDWRAASLDVNIPLLSLDLGDADWRKKVLDRTFLDAGNQPQAHFVSTRVEPNGDGAATVHGRLTLRGQTRDVALEVRLNALKRHPITQRRTAGFSATARLSRRDFGMDAWPNVIGDEVELQIEAEAQRGRPNTSPKQEPADATQE